MNDVPHPQTNSTPTAGNSHPHEFGLPPSLANIPAAIRSGHWCVWRASPRAGSPEKFDKLPYNGQTVISTAAPEQWLTFDEAVYAYTTKPSTFNGIGRLCELDGLTFIDIDTLEGSDQYITAFPTYWELSPSGNGMRGISAGTVARDVSKPVEIYAGHAPRFVTITGRVMNDSDIVDLSASLDAWIDAAAPAPTATVTRTPMPALLDNVPFLIPPDLTDSIDPVPGEGDRSAALMALTNKLLRRYSPQPVWSALVHSAWLQLALEHRRNDHRKALEYLWGTVEKGATWVAEEKDRATPVLGRFPDTAGVSGYIPAEVGADVGMAHPDLILPTDYVCPLASSQRIFSVIAASKNMFYRGGAVTVMGEEGLVVVKPESFVTLLPKYGGILAHRKLRGGGVVLMPRKCPLETAKVLLASEAVRRLPQIEVVSQHPALSYEGEILHRGYHETAKGGVLVVGDTQVPVVPVAEAVAALKGVLVDFNFTGKGDLSRAVAALLSPAMVASGQFRAPPPLIELEADESQAGKGYFTTLLVALYGETLGYVAQKKGGVGSLEESLASMLVSGQPFIVLDNVRGRISSPMLEAVLTAEGKVACRTPHHADVMIKVNRFNFLLTSNGFVATRDLANRSVIVRLLKQPEGYLFKQWPEGDTLDHLRARHSYYLGCAFAVVKEWIRAGRPVLTAKHDRRYWTDPMNWIVQTLFGLPDLMCDHAAVKDRMGDDEVAWVRALALAMKDHELIDPGQLYTASDLAEVCEEIALPVTGAPQKHDDNLLKMAQRIGLVMAKVFRKPWVLHQQGAEVAPGVPGQKYDEAVIDRAVIRRRRDKVRSVIRSGATAGKSKLMDTYVYSIHFLTEGV